MLFLQEFSGEEMKFHPELSMVVMKFRQEHFTKNKTCPSYQRGAGT
jgi:hypothetical protein